MKIFVQKIRVKTFSPTLATRPKNITQQHKITTYRFLWKKNSLAYRGTVLLPLLVPFLPVQRLTSLVDIPRNDDKTQNSFKH